MRRILRMCSDAEQILAAINSFTAMTVHYSFGPADDGERVWCYYKIGRLKVRESLVKSLCSANSIQLAEHYQEGRYPRCRIYNHCWIKSRFGETKVKRHIGGSIKWCDSAKAEQFYKAAHESYIAEFSRVLRGEGIEAAKDFKKSQIAMGNA